MQLVQTQSRDIVSCRDDGKGLWSLFRKLERGRRGNSHRVEEIHQRNQIRFLETRQIAIFSVALDQIVEIAKEVRRSVEGEVRRRNVEGVEAL